MTVLHDLERPIVQAPMAGGPSTPELAAAASNAGALGFLAAGYLTPDAFAAQLVTVRRLTSGPFGVNVFVPATEPGDAAAIDAFTKRLAPLAAANGVELGAPRFDDDAYAAKLEIIVDARPAVVSFVFGCPTPETIAALRSAAIEVWITVTDVGEARTARAAGADGLVAEGAEAGGHRSSFVDDDRPHPPLARGLVNASTDQFDADAPSAYPEIHHVTAPLRAHGRAVGNADLFNLWAGTGHRRARGLPAAELVATIGRQLRA